MILRKRAPWPRGMALPPQAAGSGAKSAETQLAGLARRALLQAFAPAAVVTDMQGKLLYVHGETGQYLRPAPGHPSLDVVDMVRDGLAAELRDALRRAATQRLPTLNHTLEVAADGDARLVSLSVRLLPEQEPGNAEMRDGLDAVTAASNR